MKIMIVCHFMDFNCMTELFRWGKCEVKYKKKDSITWKWVYLTFQRIERYKNIFF